MDKNTDDLSRQKLSLEIEKLKSPWYKNLELWRIIIPTVAILFSLYFTFGKGTIDSQKEKLEIQKEQLKLEILTFENQKREIQKSISTSEVELSETNDKIFKQRLISDSLTRQVNALRDQINKQTKQQAEITGRLSRDKNFYIRELEKQFRLENNYLTKISKLKDSISRQKENLDLRLVELNYFRGKYQLTDEEKGILKNLLLKKDMELSDKRINYYSEESNRLKKQYDEIKKGRYDTLSYEELERLLELRFIKYEGINKKKSNE